MLVVRTAVLSTNAVWIRVSVGERIKVKVDVKSIHGRFPNRNNNAADTGSPVKTRNAKAREKYPGATVFRRRCLYWPKLEFRYVSKTIPTSKRQNLCITRFEKRTTQVSDTYGGM